MQKVHGRCLSYHGRRPSTLGEIDFYPWTMGIRRGTIRFYPWTMGIRRGTIRFYPRKIAKIEKSWVAKDGFYQNFYDVVGSQCGTSIANTQSHATKLAPTQTFFIIQRRERR